MQIRLVIFILTGVLLVPFVYGISSVPEVCAAPKDPNWGKTGECRNISVGEGQQVMECCWQEPDILNPGETITWCHICADLGFGDCGTVYLKPTEKDLTNPSSGGLLQEPQTDSKGRLDSFKDRIIKLPNKTSTLSESNSSD